MRYLEVLFIITFGICAVLLLMQILLGHLLFRSLRRNHPSYYKSIGEPIVAMPVNLSDTEDDVVRNYIRGLKSGVFVYRMVFKGIPQNFPRDQNLRKFAKILRLVAALMIASFVMVVAVGYFFFRSM